MSKIDEDIEMAHAIIEDRQKFVQYFWHFFHMWAFTTINMKEYLSHFDLQDKKCVTIQGSSDHIFEMFLKRPRQIIGVDTNPLTGHYGELKIAAFKALATPEEFLKFFRWHDYPYFCKNNREAFDYDIFEEIARYLRGDSKDFWEDLFKTYRPLDIRTNLFASHDEDDNECLSQALSYITPENYKWIRENIDKLNYTFLNTDIRTLPSTMKEKQDFITLSNLIIYAHDLYPDFPIHGYRYLIEYLSTMLTDDGKIMAGYLYDIENENDHRDIYKACLRDAIFTGDNYSYIYVKRMCDLGSHQDSKNHDACLIYQKR